MGTGGLVITGITTSQTNFPLLGPVGTGTFYQPNFGGGGSDAFIGYFDPNYARILVSYLGGLEEEAGMSVTIGRNQNIFIVGTTECPSINCNNTFPTLDPGFGYYFDITGYAYPFEDIFITHLDAATNLNWSTFYGQVGVHEVPYKIDCSGRYLFLVGECYGDQGYTVVLQETLAVAGSYNQNTFGGTGIPSDSYIMKFFTDANPPFRLIGSNTNDSFLLDWNSSTELLTITPYFNENEVKVAKVFSSSGNLIEAKVGSHNNCVFDLSKTASGVYLIQIIGSRNMLPIIKS
jgi:hypothetical protein